MGWAERVQRASERCGCGSGQRESESSGIGQMTFREAVEATPSVRNHYCAGLQALPAGEAARIQCAATRRLRGSVNLDAALRQQQPNAHRWDFGIGYRRKNTEVAIWVEVHPASSTSISAMLAKLGWLKWWLASQAPELARLTKGD